MRTLAPICQGPESPRIPPSAYVNPERLKQNRRRKQGIQKGGKETGFEVSRNAPCEQEKKHRPGDVKGRGDKVIGACDGTPRDPCEGGIHQLQHRRVAVLERLAIEPPGKPTQVRPMLEDEPADGHERSRVGLHVVREVHEKQLLYKIAVDGQQHHDVRRGAGVRSEPGSRRRFLRIRGAERVRQECA